MYNQTINMNNRPNQSNIVVETPKPHVEKLAIDLGSSNLKIVTKIDGEYKFKKIKSKVSHDAIDMNYVVQTSDNTLCFGVGDNLIQQDKTKREYIEETILLSAYLMFYDSLKYNNTIEIDLAIGLPLDLYKSQNKFNSFETKIITMTNKIISGKVNGNDISIMVVSYKICAEGYSGFVALNHKVDPNTPFIIIDSGYRTTDILSINVKNIDGESEFIINEYKTFNQGLFEIYNNIQKQFLDDTGCNYDVNIIEDRMLYSPLIKIGKEKIDIRLWAKYGKHTVKEIIKNIELSIPDIAIRNVYVIGGGASLFNKIANELYDTEETVINTELLGSSNQLIFANVIGYYLQI